MAQGIDWKQKKYSTIQDTIFPKGLLEKTLFRPQIKGNVQQISDKGEGYHTNNPFKLVAYDCLEEYLRDRNPDKLIEAIMHDYTIMQGRTIEDLENWDPKTIVGDEIIDITILQMAHVGTPNEDLQVVSPPTVVWSTINNWRSYLTFHRASFYASETQEILEKYFLRIGGALIPSIIPVADGVFTEEEREIRELKSA